VQKHKETADEPVAPRAAPLDFGTKKDPTKLRKQVIAPTEEDDVIHQLLKDPIEDTKLSVKHAEVSHAKEGVHTDDLHSRTKFDTGSGFNQAKFTKRLNKYVVESRMTHISKKDVSTFVDAVQKHARVVSTGHGLDRTTRLRIKSDLTSQWKSGQLSRTSMTSLKDMLGKI
jgi:hypothetical protein